MRETVKRLWAEIDWIQDPQLREQVTQTWIKALERSPLKPDDLNQIPFTLLVPNCPITFMEHKRCVVHIARDSAMAMQSFMGRALPIDSDAVIAGAIIASRPQGYVVYPGYAQPVYGPGCYWASEPVYDGLGRVVGYTGRPVQVCPGYVPLPPPAPGYAGPPPAPPPAVQLPPK